MTLPVSGPLSFGDINVELAKILQPGRLADAPINFNEADVRWLANKIAAGEQVILPDDFYGKGYFNVAPNSTTADEGPVPTTPAPVLTTTPAPTTTTPAPLIGVITVTPFQWTWNLSGPTTTTTTTAAPPTATPTTPTPTSAVPATLPGFSSPFAITTNGAFFVYIKTDGTFALYCGGGDYTKDINDPIFGSNIPPANVSGDWVSPKSSTVGNSYYVKFTGTRSLIRGGYINGYNWISVSGGSAASPVITGGSTGDFGPTAFDSGWFQLNSDRGMTITNDLGTVGSTGGKLEGLRLKIATSATDSAIISNTLLGDFWYASVDNSGS